jgi:hypothetical protein
MARDSYALDPQQAVSSQEIAAPVGVQAGTVGSLKGGGQFEIGAPIKQDRTLIDSLFDIAGKSLEPELQRIKTEKFMQGMSRAAQGQAAADIAKESPAWVNMFGEGDVVAGARAYEGVADASDLETAVIADMPNLRKLNPDEFARTMNKMVQDRMTGDPKRDQLLQAAALKAMPGQMKAHAKANLAFKQEDALEARTKATVKELNRLDTFMAAYRQDPTMYNDEDVQNAKDRAFSVMIPQPGENPAATQAIVVQSLQAQLAGGKFDFYNLMEDNKLIEQLPIAQQDTLKHNYRVAANKAIWDKVSEEELEEYIRIKTDDNLTADDRNTAIGVLNGAVAMRTGIRAELVSDQERTRQIIADIEARQRQAKVDAAGKARAADALTKKLADDAAKKRELEAKATLARATGTTAWLSGVPGAIESTLRDVDAKDDVLIKAQGDFLWDGRDGNAQADGGLLQRRARMLIQEQTIPRAKALFDSMSTHDLEYNANTDQGLAVLNQLYTMNPDTALTASGKYVPKAMQPIVQEFLAARAITPAPTKDNPNGIPNDALWNSLVVAQRSKPVTKVTKLHKEAIDSYLEDLDLTDRNAGFLKSVMLSAINPAIGDGEAAVKTAQGALRDKGVRKVGKTYYMQIDLDQGNGRLTDGLAAAGFKSVSESALGELIDGELEKAGKAGDENAVISNHAIWRMPDVNGKWSFGALVAREDGTTKHVSITQDKVIELLKAQRDADIKSRAQPAGSTVSAGPEGDLSWLKPSSTAPQR